eukprot:1819845-Rhodomonas_salina.2
MVGRELEFRLGRAVQRCTSHTFEECQKTQNDGKASPQHPDKGSSVGGTRSRRAVMQRRRQGAVLALALLAGVALSALLSVTTQLVVVPVDDPTVLAERSPLPPHWHASKDSTGKTYYWNRALGTSSWNPPNADGSNNDGSEAGGSSDDADSLADDAAEIEEADNQPEGARGGAAMDSWDAGSTSGKASTLHGAVPQYQVTNSADDEADLNSPEDLSADAQGADASESSFADDQAQWD